MLDGVDRASSQGSSSSSRQVHAAAYSKGTSSARSQSSEKLPRTWESKMRRLSNQHLSTCSGATRKSHRRLSTCEYSMLIFWSNASDARRDFRAPFSNRTCAASRRWLCRSQRRVDGVLGIFRSQRRVECRVDGVLGDRSQLSASRRVSRRSRWRAGDLSSSLSASRRWRAGGLTE